ncbi:MAG: type II toxin-antitoxin system RelE/ParE family toxin [Gammaproteobacteria bacterium]|nr:type II toxin-antitoxin system RelE/ParE family toxin [Gammaproteobacteria bacterium]MBU1776729.1 type II toxin-antitoxin system RelE/ParE family toxin [Gammaproteobacteria bacterium]MBU1969445.1 type II toxin-antitoxin system RelE/ParE family toxin [Gammaproteobacteria bacterium]
MTLEIRLRPEAELDLEDAAIWYEKQSVGLGRQFLDEALASLSTIAESPLLYPLMHRNTRRALMRRFPFGVYYRVNPYAVIVVAIMHGSRDPRSWKSRK